eukprot:augustus_masked-scaffold_4-processed-gene-12.39-mRNA-1 protein AED:1.00 eAED:1.00 QI:0/-1/0/0/-1/1/1/0/255
MLHKKEEQTQPLTLLNALLHQQQQDPRAFIQADHFSPQANQEYLRTTPCNGLTSDTLSPGMYSTLISYQHQLIQEKIKAANLLTNIARQSVQVPQPQTAPEEICKFGRKRHREASISSSDSSSDVEYLKKGKVGEMKNVKTWQLWSREEDVILIGTVFDIFFDRGSLTSARGSDVWDEIKIRNDESVERYLQYMKCVSPQVSAVDLPHHGKRTAKALKRHYKTLKERASKEKGCETPFKFEDYFNEWRELKQRIR